jgi:hypothetical protein
MCAKKINEVRGLQAHFHLEYRGFGASPNRRAFALAMRRKTIMHNHA